MPHKGLDMKSPNHAWTGGTIQDNTISRTKIFGCESWYIDRNPRLRKGDARARKAVYLGNDTKKNGYKLLDLQTRKTVFSRDVYFNETAFPYNGEKATRTPAAVHAARK